MGTRTTFMLLLPVLLAECSLVSNEPEETEAVRIVAGESIEGIAIGDDSAAVVQKLGAPASTLTGDMGQVTLRYTQGEHAGLDVVLARDSTGSHVHRVSAHVPYEGRSKEGVGIGTKRDAVLAAWSEPDRANDLDSLRYDLYFYDDVIFGVGTHGGEVTDIDMEGLVEDPRIVWGESIEGVKIEDDSLTVIQKLGEPTSYSRELVDVLFLSYTEGELWQTEVFVGEGWGVFQMQVFGPYQGVAQQGIRIGTSRAEALRKLGHPDSSVEGRDMYHFDAANFALVYGNQKVIRIMMLSSDL